MTTKNLGAGVSGYLDPEGRAWETTVYQANKPVLDKEFNLLQDAEQDAELRLLRRTMPSGWMSGDFLDATLSTFFTPPGIVNSIRLAQDLRAHVNGWHVLVTHTAQANTNLLDLGAGPVGAGTKRTDLVVLEVWRRLIAASPSTVGKSPAARIWANGNVKVGVADDLTLNFADDILDGFVGSETTKRVQIQYRLRVIQGVDVLAYPYGMDDPVVLAHSVPPNAATPDGAATAFAYVNQSTVGDPGLWVAGDGNPANALGTVDGYMYAIPVLAVIRRNSTAFDRNTNHNGGVASPGPSDRPDGLFYDMIEPQDIVDLRLGVSPSGWDFQEICTKNFNWLLDNSLRTELTQTPNGGGVVGHIHLWADEIGITNAHGGDGVTTGDTPGASLVGEFDAVRRRFSDRSIHETIVIGPITPADGSGGGPNWADGDTYTIDPTALPIYGYAAFNWASYAPSDVVIVGVAEAHFIGQLGTNGGVSADALTGVYSTFGVGAQPMTSATFRIDNVPTGITTENLYIRLEISYPTGVGLTKTATEDFGGPSVYFNNPGQMPAGAPVYFSAIADLTFDHPHREVMLAYETVTLSFICQADTGANPDKITMPERVNSVVAITINGGGGYLGSITISDTGYYILLDPGTLNIGDFVQVDYTALRPFPQNDEQVTVYYDANAPQTGRAGIIGTSLPVIPRYISPFLYSLGVGSGSQDTAYPFEPQYVQMPGIYPTSGGSFSGDHELDSSSLMTLTNFTGDTGFLKLETLIPMVPDPEALTFTRAPGDIDSEGRSFFKAVTPGGYLPNAFAQGLAAGKRHRCVLPMVCELATDSPFGMRGQLVLVVVGSYINPTVINAPTDANAVAFDPTLGNNVTTASVYHLKGNLLNRRTS